MFFYLGDDLDSLSSTARSGVPDLFISFILLILGLVYLEMAFCFLQAEPITIGSFCDKEYQSSYHSPQK